MESFIAQDFWYHMVAGGQADCVEHMLHHLRSELPTMCSVTFERACNLRCLHCIYKSEPSSAATSREAGLSNLVLNITSQLPGGAPKLLHEGRILSPWHLEVMRAAKEQRPELRLGLIDNGNFVRHIGRFGNLRLNWIDISLDGMRKVHNRQRDSSQAWGMALVGLERAPEIASGVNVSYTLTNINFGDVYETADFVLGQGLADGIDFATMSPARTELQPYEITAEQMAAAWVATRNATEKYPGRVFFRLYRHADLEKLAHVVGLKKLWSVFIGEIENANNYLVGVEVGKISFVIDGVLVTYAPLSTWPPETFLVDADGRYGTAYSIGYTIEELRAGQSLVGEDLLGFTVAQLTPQSDFSQLYKKCVDQWWEFKGKQYFQEEVGVFKRIREVA